jgi:Tfp pilus assembly protein PilX
MKTKKQVGTILNNERGIVLVVSVLLLAVLAVLGTTAIMQTSTDLKISSNYKAATQTFYGAEAGIEEARARLKSPSAASYAGDPASSDDPWWSAYITSAAGTSPTTVDSAYDTNYKNYIPTTASHTNTTLTLNSLQSDIEYCAKILHKREFYAEQAGHTNAVPHYYDGDGSTSTHSTSSPGNIIYYGYGDPSRPTTAVQFTTAGATQHKPVEIIVGYAMNGNSVKMVTAEVVKNPGPPINAPLYAKGTVTINGAGIIDGHDNCGEASPMPPIYTMDVVDMHSASTTLDGDPATATENGTYDIDILSYVNYLEPSATEVITSDQTGTVYGSSSNFVTVYCNADAFHPTGVKLSNVTGYGILLIRGDLALAANFNWNGLVLVTGDVVFSGGGAVVYNIQGAVLAGGTADVNGSVDIEYDSCMINDSLDDSSPSVISWKDDTN